MRRGACASRKHCGREPSQDLPRLIRAPSSPLIWRRRMTLAVDHLASSTTRTTPICVSRAELFLDPLLEQPPIGNAPASARRRAVALADQATAACQACPLMVDCLYRAVVTYDVSGFVAGTTERQRAEIRRRLGVEVAPEDFDTLAGVSGGHRQVDHTEILRLRRTHPDESLERLAARLGCSLSTVKRHLRKERRNPSSDPRSRRRRGRPYERCWPRPMSCSAAELSVRRPPESSAWRAYFCRSPSNPRARNRDPLAIFRARIPVSRAGTVGAAAGWPVMMAPDRRGEEEARWRATR